ncbi:MAG: hypothetical protein K6G82_02315 [Ruminococcus sp.]|nr:hypothetical protein [Ruminococcus sp.]
MTFVLFLLAIPCLMLAMATIISIPLTVIDYIADLFEKVGECIRLHRFRRAERKRITFEIEVWTLIAKDYDSNTQAEDKGYAIARLVNLYHQLEELDNKRRSIPWIKKTTSTQARSRAEHSR